MSLSLLVGLLALVVAVLAGIPPFLAYRRQFPKRSISFEFDSSRLVTASMDELEVSYMGQQVSDPHVANLRIWSRSKADISSSSFDDHRPLVLDFGAQILSAVLQKGSLKFEAVGSQILIAAQLIDRTTDFAVALVFAERPKSPALSKSLVDIPISRVVALRRVKGRGVTLSAAIVAGIFTVLGCAVLIAVFLSQPNSPIATGASSYPTLSASNIRSTPTTAGPVLREVPRGYFVRILCFTNGPEVGGTSIWDKVSSGGWISDSVVLTGSASPVGPRCK